MSTEAPEALGILDGVCENGNAQFWIYFIGSIVMALLVCYCHFRNNNPPKFVADTSKPDFGLPFNIAILIYNICLWSLAPIVVEFILFHMITTDIFPKQTYLACLHLSGVPFAPVVLFTQATAILLLYNPNWISDDIGGEVVPAEYKVGSGNRPTKVLFLGCTSRGALLVSTLKREREQQEQAAMSGATAEKAQHAAVTEAHMVDYAHAYDAAFVRYNADCLGVVDMLPERFHRSIWVGDNRYNLPFEDASFDLVVISPLIRNSAPIGGLMTGDGEKIPRMTMLLHEAMRVLRTDGEITCCDQAASVVPIWADLRDAGYTATLQPTERMSGPVSCMKSKLFMIRCAHQQSVPLTESAATTPAAATMVLIGDDAVTKGAASTTEMVSVSQPNVESVAHGKGLSETTKLRVVVLLQCSIFLILVVFAMSLFSPLSVPTSIPISTRFSTLIAGVATGYPMMGFFSREATLESEEVFFTMQALVFACLRKEGIALLVATLMSVVMGIPGFLVQIALASSSLSSGTRSQIGLAISVSLGIAVFIRAKAAHRTRIISTRHIPDEYAQFL